MHLHKLFQVYRARNSNSIKDNSGPYLMMINSTSFFQVLKEKGKKVIVSFLHAENKVNVQLIVYYLNIHLKL